MLGFKRYVQVSGSDSTTYSIDIEYTGTYIYIKNTKLFLQCPAANMKKGRQLYYNC